MIANRTMRYKTPAHAGVFISGLMVNKWLMLACLALAACAGSAIPKLSPDNASLRIINVDPAKSGWAFFAAVDRIVLKNVPHEIPVSPGRHDIEYFCQPILDGDAFHLVTTIEPTATYEIVCPADFGPATLQKLPSKNR